MGVTKRVTTLIGVFALMASSLLASGGMAQGIGTTITVDNEPACVGSTTSIVLTQGTNQTITFGNSGLSGTNSSGGFAHAASSNSINMTLNVDECLQQPWRVDAALTDFHSGSNTVAASGKTRLYGQTTFGLPARPSGNSTPIVGTVTGLPTSNNHQTITIGRQFTSTGPDRSVATNISSGTATVSGPLVQFMRMGLINVPHTTAPGTYTATMTLTLIIAP